MINEIVSLRSIKSFFKIFRKIVSDYMSIILTSWKLSGTIEIDEAVITGKRKYHKGRYINRLYWVFGLYAREQNRGYAFLVPNRKTDVLFPIIQR